MIMDLETGKTKKRRAWYSDHLYLGGVIGIALLVRLGLYFFYAPVSYSDSRTYRRLAEQILAGWINYDGSRTPGYPAFLAIFRTDLSVWVVQMGMGILITLLMYSLGWQIGFGLDVRKRRWLAVLAALAHTLNLGQLFFEANLLSETLATFWVVLTISGWAWGFRLPKVRRIWLAGMLGVACALAILTRGLFILLPIWTILILWFYWVEKSGKDEDESPQAPLRRSQFVAIWQAIGTRLRKIYLQLLAFLVPFAVLMGLWVGFIRVYYNQWGLETMGGFHLIQNTGTFFELVPDEYAAVRDTYLKYRDAKIDQSGTQANVIWKAIPEMMEASGLGFYDLSRLVGKISLDLIRKHPDLYLKNVVKGWWLFWRAPVYWSPETLKLSFFVPVLNLLVFLERVVLWGFNIFFLISSLGLLESHVRKFIRPSPLHVCILGVILSTSILQAFLDHGDNPRFLIPMQSLVVLWGLWFGMRSLNLKPDLRKLSFK